MTQSRFLVLAGLRDYGLNQNIYVRTHFLPKNANN